MASTPEKKVKDKVKKFLDSIGAYHFSPMTGGFGRSGVPDIIVCLKSRFIAIECKANGGKTTMLQEKNIEAIRVNKGIAMVVDENNIELMKEVINDIYNH
jgi:Holliday junction resolvase